MRKVYVFETESVLVGDPLNRTEKIQNNFGFPCFWVLDVLYW
jgi:hypothetical protein